MAHTVIIGAGIGGMPMAYEMQESAWPGDRVKAISDSPCSHSCRFQPLDMLGIKKTKD